MLRGITCDFWGAVLGERGLWLSTLLALSMLACAHADRFEWRGLGFSDRLF